MARKRKRVTTRTKLGIESLERRLPFAADVISIDLEFGAAQESLQPAEHTIAGIGDIFEVAGASSEDGRHLFLYGSESGSHFQITGRLTSADGTPGPPSTLLVEIPIPSSASEFTVRFAGDLSAGGTFTLAWSEADDLYAQQFNSNLQPISSPVTIGGSSTSSGSSDASDSEISVRVNELGQVGIAYTDSMTSQPIFEIYSSDLQQRLYDWQASTSAAGEDAFDLKLTYGEEQGFGLTWLSPTFHSAHEWSGHVARFPHADSPTEISFPIYGFSDPPEIAVTSDGGVLVAGEQEQAGESQVVVNLLDAAYDPQHSYALPPEYSFAHGSGLVVTPDNIIYLGLFEENVDGDHFLVQALNDGAAPMGSPIRVSQTGVPSELEGALFPLATGGIAAYWHGLALDGVSSAILSRSYRPESVQIDLAVEGADAAASSTGSYFEILGFKTDFGLDIGYPSNSGSWIIPADEIGADWEESFQLYASNIDYPVQMQTQLVNSSSSGAAETLAAHNYIFGSTDSDILEPAFSAGTVDGRGGIDTLRIPYDLGELNAVVGGEDLWLYHGNEESLHVRSVERFRVDDSTWTLPEFLSAIADAQIESADTSSIVLTGDESSVPPPAQYGNALASGALASIGSLSLSGGNRPLRPQQVRQVSSRTDLQAPRTIQNLGHLSAEGEGDPYRPADRSSDVRSTSIRRRNAENPSELDGEGEGSEENASSKAPSKVGQVDFSDLRNMADDAELAVQQFTGNTTTQHVGQIRPNSAATQPGLGSGHSGGTSQGFVVQRQELSDLATSSNSSIVSAPTHQPSTLETIVTLDRLPKTSLAPDTTIFVATHPEPAFEQEAMFAGLDQAEESAKKELGEVEIIVGSAVVLATGFSIANIAWTLRSSILLSNLMSSLPVYVAFDPLPLLNHSPRNSLRDSSSNGCASPDQTLAEIAQHGVGTTTSLHS